VVEPDLASAKMSRGGCTMTYADYNGTTMVHLICWNISVLQSIDVL